MATQPLSNVIDPPPRLTGDAGQDTVAVIQWLNAFYVKGVLSGGLLQPQNMAPALISLGALPGAANMLAYYTAEDTFDLTGFTAFARTLLEAVNADAARVTLGAGNVNGPGSSTNNHVAVFDGITGKLLKDGGAPAGDVVGPAGATSGNVVLFDTATGKLIKDGGTLGSAAFTASGAYDAAGAAAAAQAASQPVDADLTTWASVTPGTGVATALAINVGTAGAVIVNGGALGTPSSGTLTNATGLPAAGVTGTALVAAAIGTTVQAYDADLTTWAGISPAAGVGTFLTTPSSANLLAALTDETGTGKAVFNASPTLTGTTTLPSPTFACPPSFNGMVNTMKDVASLGASSSATLFALTAYGDGALFIVFANQGAEHYAHTCFISIPEGATPVVTDIYKTNANLAISVSGTDVILTNGIAGARTATWGALRIM